MTVHRAHEHPSVERMLGDAEILADEYEDYDGAAARERIAALPRAHRAPRSSSPGYRFPAGTDRAAHDLDLAVTLVVTAPHAAAGLRRLADGEDMDPAGALVFGALLHLAGYRDAACFWWQFAAGGGSRNAAFCLFLAHRRRAEFRDAEHWRTQGRRLTAHLHRHSASGSRESLLPQEVQHDLIKQCHSGRRLVLPPRLEAAINRLHVECPDADFGEIPQPSATLAEELTAPTGP